MPKRTNHVIVVGARVSGMACALHLDAVIGVRISHMINPRDWAEMGAADRGAAHHGNLVVAGSGPESGRLAAQRVIGAL